MDILSIILIAVGLSMDCFAVSISKGLAVGQCENRRAYVGKAVWMALLFGLFQGGMPLIGFFAGTLFADFFSRFAPWIALVLLAFLGGRMIWESTHRKDCEEVHDADFSMKTLLTLAVATSIDALATGVIFIPCPRRIWVGVGIIALVSLLFSLAGYVMGQVAGKRMHFNVGVLGGVILIAIGIKIFVEGVCF